MIWYYDILGFWHEKRFFLVFLCVFLVLTPVFQISPFPVPGSMPSTAPGDGGAIQTVFQVEPDELLVAVMQDDSCVNLLEAIGQNRTFVDKKADKSISLTWFAYFLHSPSWECLINWRCFFLIFLLFILFCFHSSGAERSKKKTIFWYLLKKGNWLLFLPGMFFQDCSVEKLLGSSLVFYTNKARILAISGSEARTRRRFAAPQGRQITGMQFDNHQLMGVFLEKLGMEIGKCNGRPQI